MAGDPFDELEREIDDLRDRLDHCRQAIILSRAAIWLGVATLVIVFVAASGYRTAPVVFGALTAIIGGIVWAGATGSSRNELESQLAEATTRQSALFDDIAARNGWRDLTPTIH